MDPHREFSVCLHDAFGGFEIQAVYDDTHDQRLMMHSPFEAGQGSHGTYRVIVESYPHIST
jgi:hypothetical protein